jgi:hypothetical protein
MRFEALRREHIQERLQMASFPSAPAAKERRDPNTARWLQPDRLVPIDGKIKQWAQEVVDAAGAKTDLEKARAIYNHVVATVKYDKTGQGWGRGDIYYASEAAKNPARREYFFGAHDENRVEFSIGRDLIVNPKQTGEPLNYFVYPYAEVDEKAFASVDKTFAYRDLSVAVAAGDGSFEGSAAKRDQGAGSWSADDLIEPADLARLFTSDQKPVVLQIGVVHLYKLGHISGSKFAGMASAAEGIASLKKEVEGFPRDKAIVCYCGCCPWDHCPNIRPAYNALREMGFTKIKMLHLPNNFTQDWAMKNYPVEKGA